MRPLGVQLWSYNYDPEPTGIAPVSKVLAEALRARGHDVEVVAAHPHYPEPRWDHRLLPYRETRNGIPVLRLPLWIGRATAWERYRQELTFTAALLAATPMLRTPDIVISTSPSFPALLPAMLNARVRRVPWVIWLHDILPDGATATGIVDEDSIVIKLSRKLESAAYSAADRIVVLSNAFIPNLTAKGVEPRKLHLIQNPATRIPGSLRDQHSEPPGLSRLLSMGNIGVSQGLAPLVRAFERSTELHDVDVRFVITGSGVAAEDARRELVTDRVEMPGVVDDDRLERELREATIGVVTQRHTGAEFNIPSKLMNFMAYGLPVIAAVNPHGEVARLVTESQAGWIVDSSRPEEFPQKIVEILRSPEDVAARGASASTYALGHFTQARFAERFEHLLLETIDRTPRD